MSLTGSAGKEFLHGQTTADFSSCGDGDVRYAAFCNPKGRVLADVLAVIIDDEQILTRRSVYVQVKQLELEDNKRKIMTHIESLSQDQFDKIGLTFRYSNMNDLFK